MKFKIFKKDDIKYFFGIKKYFKDNKKKKNNSSFKSLYYTALTSLILIVFFYSVPSIIVYQNLIFNNFEEVKNNSKNDLEKVLSVKSIEEQDIVDSLEVFEDVFEYENVLTDTVRFKASVIEQIFKDTKYSLDQVRKKKYVKPVTFTLMPSELKRIESIKKRKNLFIQIILPLILEENDKIKSDRKKLFIILNKNNNSPSEIKWLNKKFKQYGVKKKDLLTLKIRMDHVPVSLAIAQAAKETGWGTSRFAIEGNALFGQWTYSGEGLKPLAVGSEETHKIMKFKILSASIRAYQRNLNTHLSYKNFRKVRAELRDNDEKLDSLILADHLDKYAETGKNYTKVLKQIINQNSLKDFDDAKLLPTRKKLINAI